MRHLRGVFLCRPLFEIWLVVTVMLFLLFTPPLKYVVFADVVEKRVWSLSES